MRLPLAIVAVSLIAASAHAQDRFGPNHTPSTIGASGAKRGDALFNTGRVLTWNSKARVQGPAPAVAPPRYVTVDVPSDVPAPLVSAPLAGGPMPLADMAPPLSGSQAAPAPQPVSLAFVTAASQPQPLGAPHPVSLAFVTAASQPQAVGAPRSASLAFVTAAPTPTAAPAIDSPEPAGAPRAGSSANSIPLAQY